MTILFLETPRFPDTVAEGASGGPTFSTNVFEAHTGLEQRFCTRSTARHRYNVGMGVRTKTSMDDMRDFFYRVKGKRYGFRFKDWNDYKMVDQNIGTGDGAEVAFNIVKTYVTGSYTYSRRIFKPVTSTIVVKVAGVTQTLTADYTVNSTRGIITFGVAPVAAAAITITCEFDVPCRFDQDTFDAQHEGYNAESVNTLTLSEILQQATDYA
jgi:uncharacterized protein (TIGR02217 family)